jgi:hypothetical protein
MASNDIPEITRTAISRYDLFPFENDRHESALFLIISWISLSDHDCKLVAIQRYYRFPPDRI